MSSPRRARLTRFDIASELDGIPPAWNPRGYVWTAPRYAWITHATFRAHSTKPDVIALYSGRPSAADAEEGQEGQEGQEGRVLRFKVPFLHTTHDVFWRARKTPRKQPR